MDSGLQGRLKKESDRLHCRERDDELEAEKLSQKSRGERQFVVTEITHRAVHATKKLSPEQTIKFFSATYTKDVGSNEVNMGTVVQHLDFAQIEGSQLLHLYDLHAGQPKTTRTNYCFH